ncbi:MAG: hypothetical protein JKY09_04045 [Crocinitomicaceae bacterium]|nr:hypothetical protein [Crocinitomicaceae bacterium]
MKLRFAVSILTLFLSGQASGQSDLDGVFEDSHKDFSIYVGSDFIRTIFGSPNVSLEAIVKNKYSVDAEIGAPLFGYREDMMDFEKNVHGGVVFNFGAGMYAWQFDYFGREIRFYAGIDFEKWNYQSSNLEVADDHSFVNDSDPFWGDYTYTLENDYQFRFDRKITRFGINLAADYEINAHLRLLWGFHIGYAKQKIKFDTESSYGVNWSSSQPNDWHSGFLAGNDVNGRFSLALKIKI